MRAVALALLVACGGPKDDRCSRAVDHVLGLTVRGKVADGERQVIEKVRAVSLATCREEGLSQAQADCILALTSPDWSDSLRACPAFAAKPASWITLAPPREARTGRPDGPHEGPIAYREITGTWGTTCGLADDVACWGNTIAKPAGIKSTLRIDGIRLCGLDAAGLVVCAGGDPQLHDRAPKEPMHDFAIARDGGCGIRAKDGSLTCWSPSDADTLVPPSGVFVDIALAGGEACARREDDTVVCFGDPGSSPPATTKFTSIAMRGRGACGLRADQMLECWGDEELGRPPAGTYAQLSCGDRGSCCALTDAGALACFGEPLAKAPAGTFDRVFVMRGHACAVRRNGGTICWGDNDDGQNNVPQAPAP